MATACSSCGFDIAGRDPSQMVVRARRDVKTSLGLVALGVVGVVLCGVEVLAGMPLLEFSSVPPAGVIAGVIGVARLRHALRRLAIARKIERVPAARVVIK